MKKVFLSAIVGIILVIVTVSSVIICKRLLYLDTYKDDIIAALKKSLHREIIYEKGAFTLGFIPSFTFTRVIIKEKDSDSVFVSTDKLTFKIALLPLLEKKLLLKEVHLENPVFRLLRSKNGVFNFSDIFEGEKEAVPLQVKSIRINHGSVTFIDQAVAQPGLTTSLENIDFYLSRLSRGENSDLKIAATM